MDYAKYRVIAYDEFDVEIGVHVYDGTPEQVIAEMASYLSSEMQIYPARYETDRVTYTIGV